MKSLSFFVTLVALVAQSRSCCSAYSFDDGDDDDDDFRRVTISSKCAAVLLAGASAGVGGVRTYLLPALGAAGFCDDGLFDTWWRYFMSQNKKRRLIAKLQRLTLRDGQPTLVMDADAAGGEPTAKFLHAICEFVDESNHETQQMVISAIETDIKAKNEKCAASPICTLFKEAASIARDLISSAGKSFKYGASTLRTKMEASELGAVVVGSISFTWRSLKAGTLKLKTLREVLILQNKIKEQIEAFGWMTFELLREMKHEAWTDKTLKEIFDVSLEKVRALEKEQAQAWKFGPVYKEFGILAFDYLMQARMSELDDPDLTRIYTDTLKAVSELETRILKKRIKLAKL